MNERDEELIYGLLAREGYIKAESAEEAHIVLFNTCSVRKHAEDRAYGNAAMLKKWKKANPHKILGIVGCMAQSHKERIFARLPHVDFICGPANIFDIPGLIAKRLVQKERMYVSALGQAQRPDVEQPAASTGSVSAHVSISEGCDNFCSYCIVPYVRGRVRNRTMKLVLDEVKQLADSGCREVTLLGQNVNSYRNVKYNKKGFIHLLEEINRIKGIERIRFTTSHPKDAGKPLFKAMRDLDKVCEHLHLPLQSGSDTVLKRMARNYTRQAYLKLVEEFKKILPSAGISTDMIVGFPGETARDFRDTYDVMEEIGFDSAFIFKYSPRPPAKSSELKDDVPMPLKEERNHVLLKLQEDISLEIHSGLVGKEEEVLVSSANKKQMRKSLRGRTRTNKTTVFDGEQSMVGQLVNVKIKKVTPNTLIGEAEGREKK